MADNTTPIGVDASGHTILTKAVLALLNAFPGLNGRTVHFEELSADGGIAFSANNGALIMKERVSITGRTRQTCQYPFYVVYRSNSTRTFQALAAQTFLDTMGKWLCGEPAIINGETVRRTGFPVLDGSRTITKITRSNSYGLTPAANGVQDWLLPVTVQYTNEFDA
ncbi:MAG: hypothetical protein IJY28_01505 [Clostridia bacterium]|nr:hypothetical protein [Clostridia bacterium]